MSEMTQKNRRRISFQNGLSIYFFKRKEKKHKVPTLKKNYRYPRQKCYMSKLLKK